MIRTLLDSIPEGNRKGRFGGRTYVITKSIHNSGRSIKLYAEECGGNDFISLNYYKTGSGELLKPCEMPEEKVLRFLSEVEINESL